MGRYPVRFTQVTLRVRGAKDLEPALEAGAGRCGVQLGGAVGTAEGNEVKVAFVPVSPEVERHASS